GIILTDRSRRGSEEALGVESVVGSAAEGQVCRGGGAAQGESLEVVELQEGACRAATAVCSKGALVAVAGVHLASNRARHDAGVRSVGRLRARLRGRTLAFSAARR